MLFEVGIEDHPSSFRVIFPLFVSSHLSLVIGRDARIENSFTGKRNEIVREMEYRIIFLTAQVMRGCITKEAERSRGPFHGFP